MTIERETFLGEIEPKKNMVEAIQPLGVDLFYSDLEEARERRKLFGKIDNIFDKVNDVNMEINEALGKGLIGSDELTEVYNGMTDFLKKDPNNSRIILYLPLQLLPNLNNDEDKPRNLIESEIKFANVYREAWIRLLFDSDVRADFVDGDVLEPGLGELQKVRKAAHLAKEILGKGIIDKKDIDLIMEINNNDWELTNSLLEGLSDDNFTEKSVTFDLSILEKELKLVEDKYGPDSPDVSVFGLREKYKPGVIPDTKISRERANWKRKLERGEIFERYAGQISDEETINFLMAIDSPDSAYKIIGLKAIFNQNKQSELANQLINKYWQSEDNQIKETIITGLSYWQRNGVISDKYLEKMGIKITDLSLPFPVDLDRLASVDFKNLFDAVEEIEKNPVLKENIYPLFLAFGSRVKGYAGLDADQDMAIFFRPEAAIENRETILKLVRTIPGLENIGKICEFWTKEKDGKIGIRAIPEKIWGVVGMEQIHFIFGGIWIGNKLESKKIRQDILEKFLNLSGLGERKNEARYFLVKQLENDMLQCRLMHKGYRKYYPDKANGKSVFWDPGFRRVATKLFLSRVFLPDLS